MTAIARDVPAAHFQTSSHSMYPSVAAGPGTTKPSQQQQQQHYQHHQHHQHHQHRPSTLSSSRSRRSLATVAKEKTTTAWANLSQIGSNVPTEHSLRTAASSNSLSPDVASDSSSPSRQSVSSATSSSSADTPRPATVAEPLHTAQNLTAASKMAKVGPSASKMHQTSSKILRMTDDRPFTRDFKDLFATLITSLPMDTHRVRFTKIDETFLSEEAITNLGSLKFSQSNRIPDPKNPSRWVVTTTTTTFSMAKEMARSVCQRFVDARLIESAEQKVYAQFPTKGALWQLTPKGTAVLKHFCDRNGIEARHIEPIVRRPQMNMVALERNPDTDRLIQDRTTVEVIFRRFAGQDGPNLKQSVQVADSDSISEYSTGLVGVKMARDRRIGDRIVHNTFTGKAASDWLLDCTSTIDRRETFEMCELFVTHNLMAPRLEDRSFIRMNPGAAHFQPTKHAIYTVTEKGQRICGWISRPPSVSSDENPDSKDKNRMPKDTNMNRLNTILNDAALRLLFKEHLRSSLCEENLNFYLDAQEFSEGYRGLEVEGRLNRSDAIRETLATAYGLYNSFLASGAPSELNMDHSLRNKLDSRMTQTDSDASTMQDTLKHVVELIELASSSVFKLMASDSVPKFIRDPRYQQIFRDHELDVSLNGPSRTMSPAPEKGLTRSETAKRVEQ